MKEKIRINRYLSKCGLGSRRKVEEHINNGKIKFNGLIVKSLSLTVDPEEDIVEYNNKLLKPINAYYYLILNKPKGIVTSMKDDKDRPIVMDFISEDLRNAMVRPVGRLDKDTEGLLLLTNDGDMAFKLSHPKFEVKKEYVVELNRPLDEKDKTRIEKGIFLDGKMTKAAYISFLDKSKKKAAIIISEGRKRQIRLSFRKFAYNVNKLKRISYGPIKLGSLKSGSYRMLKSYEIRNLTRSIKSLFQ